jgi:hypothetical protein
VRLLAAEGPVADKQIFARCLAAAASHRTNRITTDNPEEFLSISRENIFNISIEHFFMTKLLD